MKRQILFFIGLFLSFAAGSRCVPSRSMYVKQGVSGYVRILKGNQMPSPGMPRRTPKGIPATICIYTLVNLSQVEPDQKASFFRAVRARLVKTVQADSTGHFEASLDTGGYSLFIRVGGLYYASLTDQFNHLAPIRVEASRVTHIALTYAAEATF
jgi:hypothetical protein